VYIVVTGAAGFIGSNLVRALNARGERDIIAVDNLRDADKFRNLADCDVADYLDQDEFIARISAGDFEDDITAVLHQGACADTMETDGRFMMRNNYRYSVALLDHCQDNDIPFLYASSASVYGAGTVFAEDRANEAPLNVYGYSKCLFDRYVRRMLSERTAQVVGFRYFNVYGPREQHKGAMASVAFHFYRQFRSSGASSCSKARADTEPASSAGTSSRRRRGQGQPRFSRPPEALRNLQPGHRSGRDVQCGRARDGQCVPGPRRQGPRSRWPSWCIRGRSNTSRSRRRSSESTRASRKPTSPRCAPRAIRRRC
jgi:hypothetical protein